MDKLTSFVRTYAVALRDRARWQLRALRVAFTLKPIRGADGEGGDPAGDPPGSPAGGVPEKKHTDADVEQIVQQRLARDREQRGVDITENGLRELRDKAARADSLAERVDELEGAQQTDIQRLQTEKEQAEQAKADAEQTAAEATQQAQEVARRAEVITEATKLGAVDPNAVHALLKEQGFKFKQDDDNELSVTVGDDGQVTGAEETVKAFLEADANKYLVGTTPGPGPGDGGPRKPAPTKGLDEQIAEAEEAGDWSTVNRLNAEKLGQAAERN